MFNEPFDPDYWSAVWLLWIVLSGTTGTAPMGEVTGADTEEVEAATAAVVVMEAVATVAATVEDKVS